MQKRTFTGLAVALLTASVATAQDECATAVTATLGAVPFDTTAATLSAEVWPCALGGGADIWYTVTPTSATNTLRIETCGSSYDTALEVFTGSCGALVPLICNDDGCTIPGFHSSVEIPAPGTQTYTFRIGGYNGAVGTGTLTISEIVPPPPAPANCVETTFVNNNGGGVGGAVYFDLTAVGATGVASIWTNYGIGAGTPVGIEVYTTPGTHVGVEADPTAWTLQTMDDGTAIADAVGMPTMINFASAWNIPAGTMGVALVAIGSGHSYTNGIGANQTAVSGDGNLTINAGSATNVAFAGAPFTPRVWNGRLCSGGMVTLGTPYCAAELNATGVTGKMSATGSATAASNDFTLLASDLPTNQFGLFVTSATQGFVPMAGGTSNGNLCLGGVLGRYQGPGQVQSSGGAGEISLMIDLTSVPQGGGTVAMTAGSTQNFQLWHREPVGLGSNFTEGLEMTFN